MSFFQAMNHLEVSHQQKPKRRRKVQETASSKMTIIIKRVKMNFLENSFDATI